MSYPVYQLKNKDAEMYSNLVKIAGGDNELVIKAIKSKNRKAITLSEVVDYIEANRK